jgi:hypothetical protein
VRLERHAVADEHDRRADRELAAELDGEGVHRDRPDDAARLSGDARSALSPSETNDDSPMPRWRARSIAAMPNAPLWDAKPTRPAGGAPGENVASRATAGSVLTTPRQFGPTMRMPAARQIASSSR